MRSCSHRSLCDDSMPSDRTSPIHHRTDAAMTRMLVVLPLCLVALMVCHDIERYHLARAHAPGDGNGQLEGCICEECHGDPSLPSGRDDSEQWLPRPSMAPPLALSELQSIARGCLSGARKAQRASREIHFVNRHVWNDERCQNAALFP